MPATALTNDYRQAATKIFEWLMQNYDSSYWILGHSFDTIIDYLDNVDHSKAADVGNMVVKQYQIALNKTGGYDSAWFDDFGWWTVATQRAVGKPFFKPDVKNQFRGIMSECWKRFTGNAPYVWDRRAPGTFNDYRSAVDGGAWNEYWVGTSSTFPGPKDGDPSSGTLQGIQNTVTNALYLVAAQRLGSTDPDAKTAAEREYNFLSNWFWQQQQDPLWWLPQPKDHPNAALVRERVSHFYNGREAGGFLKDWTWTGDQGLVLGALTDRMRVDPGNYQWLLDRAKQLLIGARILLVNESGVLTSWTGFPENNAPDGDARDYSTGAGVFWRNVLYAWKGNQDLRAFLNDPAYRQFVRTSADVVKAPTNETDLVALTNELAVLVAAAVILA